MKHTIKVRGVSPVSEMVIVDTFTKLIFGEESGYNDRELQIIQALRVVDENVAVDRYRDMGNYLRALGVQEMIGLVARVRASLARGVQPKRTLTGAVHPENTQPTIAH